MKRLLFLAIFAFIYAKKDKPISYKGYKGLSIVTPDEESVQLVDGFKDLGVKVLHEPSTKRACEIAVPPELFEQVVATITEAGLAFRKLYDDLQELVDDQKKESRINRNRASFRSYTGDLDYSIATYFPTYKQANDWMGDLERRFPDLAHIKIIGRTHENRDQVAIQIGKTGIEKPVVWIDGGIHAREWATVPTVLYIATRLLAGYASGETKELLDKYDFYLLPVFNPDGYTYTHEMDRFWRKNRRPSDYGCPGVDLNRNFGHFWGVSGVSRRKCDDSYLGPSPFSEPETQNVRDTLMRFKGRLQMYLNLHAYGQLWFIPYGHDHTAEFEDIDSMYEHYRIAEAATRAIYNTDYRRTRYTVGKPGELLYDAAGGTFDWAYAVAGAKYAFAAELSPSFHRGRGLSGFEISPNEILPIAKEVFNGVRAALEAM